MSGARTRRAGSIRRRGDRKWLVSIYIGTHPDTGKRIYRSKTIHGTKRDADEYLRDELTKKDIGILQTKSRQKKPSLESLKANISLFHLGRVTATQLIAAERQNARFLTEVASLRAELDRAKRGGHTGYLYIIQGWYGGAIKIGFASNVENRLRGLQTANPDRLRLISKRRSPAEGFDQAIHRILPANSRATGEWFYPSSAVVSILRSLGFGTSRIAFPLTATTRPQTATGGN